MHDQSHTTAYANHIRQAIADHPDLGGIVDRARHVTVERDDHDLFRIRFADPELQRSCAQNSVPTVVDVVRATLPATARIVYAPTEAAAPTAPPTPKSRLAPDKRMDNFLSLSVNRLALRAIHESLDSPTPEYNPLVLSATFSQGKSHLLSAYAQEMLERHPEARIVHHGAADFLESFLYHRKNGSLDLFRLQNIYANHFLMDDLHRLAGQTEAQDFLFDLFETLHERRIQIFFTSLHSPQNLPDFCPRLVSRLMWGVSLHMEALTPAARVEIMRCRGRSGALRQPLEEDVIQYLSQQPFEAIYRLDAMLGRIDRMASEYGKPLPLENVKSLVGGIQTGRTGGAQRAPTMAEIEGYFLSLHNLTTEMMHSPCRARHIAFPRQMAMYFSHQYTHASMESIGQYYGGRDHSTVKYACEKVAELIRTDEKIRLMAERFKSHFNLL